MDFDFPGRIIAGVLATILVTLYPLPYLAQSSNETVANHVDEKTQLLSEEIRSNGYLDTAMYEEYMNYLSETGELYDVKLEDIHPVTGEEITESSAKETNLQLTSHIDVDQAKDMQYLSTTIEETQPISKIPLGMEPLLNTKQLSEDQSLTKSFGGNITILSTSHTHSNACYAGDPHICNGVDCEYLGKLILVRIGIPSSGNSPGFLQYSLDKGSTWITSIRLAYDQAFTDITYGNGMFFAFTSNSSMYYSTDGINWTFKNKAIDNTTFTIRSVTYRAGTFYAIANNFNTINYSSSSFSLFTSTDGFTWTNRHNLSLPTGSRFERMKIVNNNIFIIADVSSMIYYIKPNSLTITLQPVNNEAGSYRDIEYYNGAYYGIGGSLWTSTDLVTWTRSTTNSSDFGWGLNNIITDNGDLYVLGSGKTLKSVSSEGIFRYRVGPLYFIELTTLPYTGYYELPITYDGNSYYLSVVNSNLYTTQNFTSWSHVYTSSSDRIKKIICNANGGFGNVDLGPCQKVGKYYDANKNEVFPICNSVVTGITATNPIQIVLQGGDIIKTAVATYLDGHTGIVNCTSSGFNSNSIGVQTVTLTYTGLVNQAKNWGSKTCTLTVTVQSAAKQCTAGRGHPDYDGSLSECPVCKAIAGLSVVNQTFLYDGNHHELNIGNSTGVIVNAAYDIDPNPAAILWQWNKGPVLPGSYLVHIYVYVYNSLTGTWGDYFAMERYLAIEARLDRITVSPASQTIQRYSTPVFTVTAYYEDGSSLNLSSGYTVTGINTKNIGTQTATISYTTNGVTKTATVQVKVTGLILTCPKCSFSYELGSDDHDPGCPKCKTIVDEISVEPDYLEVTQGSPLPITVKVTMKEGTVYDVVNWSSNYDPNTLGLQTVTVEYGGLAAIITVWVHEENIICPICNTPYPISLPKCPVCSNKVVSISVSPNEITVNQYEDIQLNVVAHYADGSSSPVTDWSIDQTSAVAGDFTATVTYEKVTASVALKVLSLTAVECPFCGIIYEPTVSLTGCPICSKTLTGIEAYLTSGSNLVQYGSTPSLSIVLIFKDTHREIIEDGYTIENFNSHQLGVQEIKVVYKEFDTLLEIEVTNALSGITCPKGHVYYRNADGSDPGCPYCTVSEDLDTVLYYDITYTDEIMEKLYSEGIYYFQSGNYLTIHVYKKNRSLFDRMQSMFFGLTLIGKKEDYIYGGEVFSWGK